MIKIATIIISVIIALLYFFYIKKYFIAKYVPSDRRLILKDTLVKRQVFPIKEWKNHGIPDDRLQNILAIICYCLEWPNAHFAPSDRLADIMQDASFSLAHCEMLFLFKSNLNIDISKKELIDAIKNNDTLGDWLKSIVDRECVCPLVSLSSECPRGENDGRNGQTGEKMKNDSDQKANEKGETKK